MVIFGDDRSRRRGQAPRRRREVLVARALQALSVTPATIAAAEGLDPRDLPLLLAGSGDPALASRLAGALSRAGAELEQLARELDGLALDGG